MQQTIRKKRKRPDATNWLTTYSDMVTLLLCFFILLYSFSALDVEKFRQFVASFQGQGILDRGSTPLDEDTLPPPADNEDPSDIEGPFWDDLGSMIGYIKDFLEKHEIDGVVHVYREERGVLIELRDHVLFDSSRADIRREGVVLLDTLTLLFEEMPNSITVEGHTDNIPINTVEFPSNWELSSARASRVVRYFTEIKGLEPTRFAAAGYGEYHPVESNLTAEGRSRNRRVVLVIREF